MGAHVPFNPKELSFLNNFYTRFQLGTEPYAHTHPEGLHRFTMRKCGWDIAIRAHLQNMVGRSFVDEADLLDYCSAHSDKYLDQTPAQFYAEIETVMVDLGISVDEITTYLNVKVHDEKTRDFGGTGMIEDTLNLPLRPIYQALRERGYNKKDLWA